MQFLKRNSLAWFVVLTMVMIAGSNLAIAQQNEPTDEELDILYYGLSDDCQLPCWNGLEVGSSSFSDTIRTFGDFFSFSSGLKKITSFDTTTESWFFFHDDPENANYSTTSTVRVEGTFNDDMLVLLEFSWSNSAMLIMPLQRIFQEFGTPEEVIVGISGAGASGYATWAIWLGYGNQSLNGLKMAMFLQCRLI